MAAQRNPDGWGRKPHRWRGRWRAFLTTGYAPNGDAIRRYVYGLTERECADKLDQARLELRAGVTNTSSSTLNAYLDTWLEQKALEVKPRTLEIYTYELAHVRKHLGRKRLGQVRPIDVQTMMRLVNGSRSSSAPGRGGRGDRLSARAANEARNVLSNALKDAVTLGLIAFNPAQSIRAIRHEAAPLQVWTAEEIMRFTSTTLSAAAAYHALYYLALTAGLRPGELIALEWRDLRRNRLHVSRTVVVTKSGTSVGTTKTENGTRVLALPADTLATLATQRRALAQVGLESQLVFPTARGNMVSHSNLLRSLKGWAVQAKVPEIRMHDLRHTYASMAISAGITPAELARQLGHADPAFTMKRYVHFFEQVRPREAPSLAELMGSENRAGVFSGGTGPNVLPN